MRPLIVLFIAVLTIPLCRGQDMPLSQLLIDGEGWRALPVEFQSIHDLTADGAGNLFVMDYKAKRVARIDPAGKITTHIEVSWFTSRLRLGPEGLLYVSKNVGQQISAYDSGGKEVKSIPRLWRTPQDLVVLRNGTIFYVEVNSGEIYRVDRDGKEGRAGPAAKINTPIWTLGLSPDEQTLYANSTYTSHLYAFVIDKDRQLSAVETYGTWHWPQPPRPATVFGRSWDYTGAKGLTVDTAGRVYVATSFGLQVFDTQGRLAGVIDVPTRVQVADAGPVSLGGPNGDTLYVVLADKLYARKIKAHGVFPSMKKP
jgi:sugar lactone lactonase YvrE